VDTPARRIATFVTETLADITKRVDIASPPPDAEPDAERDSFMRSVQRPAAQQCIAKLMKPGLQGNPDVKTRLPYDTGMVSEPPP